MEAAMEAAVEEDVKDDASFDENRKCMVKFIVHSAHVDVQEPKQLKVEWSRKNKSVRSKGLEVDNQNKVAKFKE